MILEKINERTSSLAQQRAKSLDTINQKVKNADLDWIMGKAGKVNQAVQSVAQAVIDKKTFNETFISKVPIIGSLVKKYNDEKFLALSSERQIDSIFQEYNKISTLIAQSCGVISFWIQECDKQELITSKEIEDSLEKLKWAEEMLESLNKEEDSESLTQKKSQLTILIEWLLNHISTLEQGKKEIELTKERLKVKYRTAAKYSLAMKAGEPIFKNQLVMANLEDKVQTIQDAAEEMLGSIWKAINDLSWEQTMKTIQSLESSTDLTTWVPWLDIERLKADSSKLALAITEAEKKSEEGRKLMQTQLKELNVGGYENPKQEPINTLESLEDIVNLAKN